MILPIFAALGSSLLGVLLCLVAIFLILLVLVQRGRGGGLAGALGGMGGSSAFGAKAGDVFTKITAVAAFVWILLCIVTAKWGSSGESRLNAGALGGNVPAAAAGDAKEAAPAAATAGEGAEKPAATTPAVGAPAVEMPAVTIPAPPSGDAVPAGEPAAADGSPVDTPPVSN